MNGGPIIYNKFLDSVIVLFLLLHRVINSSRRLTVLSLVYYGDAANVSFLQLLRMMMETALGTSPFTSDPNRNRTANFGLDEPIQSRIPFGLPDKHIAVVLTRSFFIHVSRRAIESTQAGTLRSVKHRRRESVRSSMKDPSPDWWMTVTMQMPLQIAIGWHNSSWF